MNRSKIIRDDLSQRMTCGYYDAENERLVAKRRTYLGGNVRNFISISSFVVIASADHRGRCDAHPRHDRSGFVAVLDEKTLLIPDREGNDRIGTFKNVIENPRVGVLFLVPGLSEAVRVNGVARLEFDEAVLRSHALEGQPPLSALIVTVEEVFFHCARSVIRSDLWPSAKRATIGGAPSLGTRLAYPTMSARER